MKKRLQKPAVLAAALAGATLMTVGAAGVSAATDTTAGSNTTTSNSRANSGSSIIDKLVTKFGLNKSEVQAVFDDEHEERQAERQKSLETRLSQAVTDGKLTQDQKSKIQAKQQEMQTFMDSLKDKTEDERHTAMETKRTELQTWATDNNIPEEYTRFAMGRGGHGPDGGMGGPRGGSDGTHTMKSTSSSASSTQ